MMMMMMVVIFGFDFTKTTHFVRPLRGEMKAGTQNTKGNDTNEENTCGNDATKTPAVTK